MAVMLPPQWPRTQSTDAKQQSEAANAAATISLISPLVPVDANREEKHGERHDEEEARQAVASTEIGHDCSLAGINHFKVGRKEEVPL